MNVRTRIENHVELMNCMEVWGGSGARNNHLPRPGLDIWIWSEPRGCTEAGGGDLHLVSSCASGRITRMLLADVCGFGASFAEVSRELRDLLKRSVNTIQQTRTVREVSQRLEAAASRGAFVSTLISTYFAPTRSFTLCNAGHPPPLLYRASNATWSIIKAEPALQTVANVPFGVVDPVEYQEFKTKLELGDMVFSYSNVLTECRSSDGSTIGVKGVLDLVRSIDLDSMSDFGASLASQLRDEHTADLQGEDATILLCRASNQRVAWRDNLIAPFRMLRSATDRTEIV